MNENELKASLETYHQQLNQVESVLLASGSEQNEDLVKLQGDLKELINLTQDSLLSLEKSKLLMLIEGSTSTNSAPLPSTSNSVATEKQTKNLDDEFEVFQRALTGDSFVVDTDRPICSTDDSSLHIDKPYEANNVTYMSDGGEGSSHTSTNAYSDIVGTKCRVALESDWAPCQYHNAMIVCLEDLDKELEPKVRVLFCNPTHRTMLPCSYYLEDKCRFSDADCRYSHGHIVEVEKLEAFLEPDYSKLTVDTLCLAKDTDGLWYRATVVDIDTENHTYHVLFTENHAEATVDVGDIIPVEGNENSDYRGPESPAYLSDQDNLSDDDIPVLLWQPGMNSMGEWESHTKGIGSKLMKSMGYVSGQGLGKNQDGRVEPVPIQLLPSGKSLDKIMELKAIAGDQNLYDVMKKQKRNQKKVDEKAAKSYNNKPNNSQTCVFDFINKKLGNNKGDIHDVAKKARVNGKLKKSQKVNHISEKDLSSRSDHQINVQMLKTHEEIKGVESEINRLNARLESNIKGRDSGMVRQLEEKIASMETYLNQLKTSEQSLKSHKQTRSDNKKLVVF